MKRCTIAPRASWRARVEEQGLLFHSVMPENAPTTEYWGEGVYYEFTPAEVAAIERATDELHAMCLAAAEHVIAKRRYAELGVPEAAIAMIERAWEAEPPSVYGRMDLAFGPDGVPKLLEYNADTPTSLLEGAVIQWTWLTDCFPSADQFNSIHERLIETWRDVAPYFDGDVAHFGCVDDLEDEMTVGYLRDTATQAGLTTVGIQMEDIGWDGTRFIDLEKRAIRNMFKLYPWEAMWTDEFAPMLVRDPDLRWVEPVWKMLLSTKGILPILWELYPGHPNLLEASREPLAGAWVRKPIHGREGNNVTIAAPGVSVETGGPYDSVGYVYQAYADLGEHAGMRPVIGSWVIGGAPAGIGIRETAGYVTNNTACFVPHMIR
jgi:glutathionylspermidine synthase